MIALAQPSLLGVVGVVYLALGAGIAWRISQSHGWGTGAAAFVAWPVFIPLLSPTERVGTGPHTARIRQVFAALEETLADPAAGEVPWDTDLTGLRSALQRTDERLGLVDRLLSESQGARTDGLSAAREKTSREIEAVLEEVVQLRLQIGLAALAGNAASVRERLSELLDRAEALDEVATLHG